MDLRVGREGVDCAAVGCEGEGGDAVLASVGGGEAVRHDGLVGIKVDGIDSALVRLAKVPDFDDRV